MVSPSSLSWGVRLSDASLDCQAHTLRHIGLHANQASVVERRVWQEDGPSERRVVSSAYCSRLDHCDDAASVYPRLECRLVMVSTRVFMTVLNTSTDRGSPWKTPIWRWMGADCQKLLLYMRSSYELETITTISRGAW